MTERGRSVSEAPHPVRRYDPELLAVRSTLPTVDANDVAGQRRATAESFRHFRRQSDQDVTITDHGLSGSGVRLRVYEPSHPVRGGLLWVHGGAFVLGSPEDDDDICRDLAASHHQLVVSPDYRLAPEHPWPAAEEDCAAALAWLVARLSEAGVAAAPAVAGASAGGALALRTALDAVATGLSLDRLLLTYPVVDTRLGAGSTTRYAKAPVFDGEQARLMWGRYLATATPSLWRSPLTDPHLGALPLTMVVTTEHDPLRDEGLELAMAMLSAGVSVEVVNLAGTFHAFDRFAAESEPARRLRATVSEFLGRPSPVAADW
ncbi:acetyl esterase/lipase [Phycicoccus duodecadis]|uniref:Acetyl esterase/lipase n=1 Tax=Phycicoccus duodecadis TaxID=173053 RepID=A0A2N3YIR6_9MICO|nr:acetyl esterase/lipase [Phycicoccus duodecadis]